MAHTPGPWKEDRWEGEQPRAAGWRIVGVNGEDVMTATVNEDSATFTLPQKKNMTLILAAPNLLASLRRAVQIAGSYADSIDERCDDTGCLCDFPGRTRHSQYIRDEIVQFCEVIAMAEENKSVATKGE